VYPLFGLRLKFWGTYEKGGQLIEEIRWMVQFFARADFLGF
jgi:hypothetical protein